MVGWSVGWSVDLAGLNWLVSSVGWAGPVGLVDWTDWLVCLVVGLNS